MAGGVVAGDREQNEERADLLVGQPFPVDLFATSWPMYVANYSDVSSSVAWMAAAVSVALCVMSVLVVVEFQHRTSADATAVMPARDLSHV